MALAKKKSCLLSPALVNPYELQMEEVKGNLWQMLENEVDTDVVVECGGEEFHVHKFVLIMSSQYFQNYFKNNVDTAVEQRIQFPDIEADVMKVIIDFIYLSCSDLPEDVDKCAKIYKAAHFMEIEPLIQYYCVTIVKNLNTHNYLDMWKLAELYNDDDMVKGIGMYILNNLRNVMQGCTFKHITYQKLNYIIDKLNLTTIQVEDYVMEGILYWVKWKEDRQPCFVQLCNRVESFDLSKEYLTTLINRESLVKDNAHVLIKLLKSQMLRTEEADRFALVPKKCTSQ